MARAHKTFFTQNLSKLYEVFVVQNGCIRRNTVGSWKAKAPGLTGSGSTTPLPSRFSIDNFRDSNNRCRIVGTAKRSPHRRPPAAQTGAVCRQELHWYERKGIILMSGVFRNIDPPPPHRPASGRVCTPRPFVRGKTHSLGGEGVGGQ